MIFLTLLTILIYYVFNKEDFPKTNLAKHITTEIDKIWLKHNKLSLNVEKTKYMTFHTSQNHSTVIDLNRYKM